MTFEVWKRCIYSLCRLYRRVKSYFWHNQWIIADRKPWNMYLIPSSLWFVFWCICCVYLNLWGKNVCSWIFGVAVPFVLRVSVMWLSDVVSLGDQSLASVLLDVQASLRRFNPPHVCRRRRVGSITAQRAPPEDGVSHCHLYMCVWGQVLHLFHILSLSDLILIPHNYTSLTHTQL